MVLSASIIIQWIDSTITIAPAVIQCCNNMKQFLNEDIIGYTQSSNVLSECLINFDNALISALTVL